MGDTEPFNLFKMVGPTGFEPATPSPPAKCATRLRYGPTYERLRTMLFNFGASSLYLYFTDVDTNEGLACSRNGLTATINEGFCAVAIVDGGGGVVFDAR